MNTTGDRLRTIYFILRPIYRCFQASQWKQSADATPKTFGLNISQLESSQSPDFFIYIFLKSNLFVLIIFNSIYFKAIQTAAFYQKNMYKLVRPNFFMFIDLEFSCDQNKSYTLGKTDCQKVASKIVGYIVKALETPNKFGQFHFFGTFLEYCFVGFLRPV